ncbi:MAG TPA: response regulator [Bacteroidales bacterium]|nr:response regulator [Bacteroidales bacterium]
MKVDHLLLVDDSDIDNLINKKVVENNQFARQIMVVKSVNAAIRYLLEIFSEDSPALPDMIFLDIRMPDQDGFDFLEKFRQLDSHIKSQCKIVMLTSSIDADDYRNAMENPYVIGFINKPLTSNALQQLCV